MSFSHYAGVALVPTLSRIVLATAFITAGYKKVFTDAEYTLDEARKLQSWNITVTPTPTTAMAWPRGGGELQWEVVLASYRQSMPAASSDASPSTPATPQATQPETPQATQPAAPPAPATSGAHQPAPEVQPQPPPEPPTVAPAVATPPPVATTELSQSSPTETPSAPSAAQSTTAPASAPYTARSMWKIALMLDAAAWPQPKTQACLASYTEFGGGLLILIGLFSRIWGLGLSIVMGVAFYFTSFPALQAHGWNPNALPFSDFVTLTIQMALFALAFGVLLTGPGPLSIDRILFGGPREDVDVVEVKRERA